MVLQPNRQLSKDLADLQKDGWNIGTVPRRRQFRESRHQDDRARWKPQSNPNAATSAIARVLYKYVHGRYVVQVVTALLADEGAATMKSIQVQQEITAAGGPGASALPATVPPTMLPTTTPTTNI